MYINRCIALGATKEIVEDYFKLKQLEFGQSLHPFSPQMQIINAYVDNDIGDYIKVLSASQSQYVEAIKSSIKNKIQISDKSVIEDKRVTITINGKAYDELTTADFDELKKIRYVPALLDVSGKAAKNLITLIGIMDVFVRNAIEHGEKECKIDISWEFGANAVDVSDDNADYSNSYSIVISNKRSGCSEVFERASIGSEYTDQQDGFTRVFFEKYLSKRTTNVK